MRFDIILPTIGRESLNWAVQSVLQQTYSNWRLHIVGDGIDMEEIGHFCDLDGRIGAYIILPRRNDYGADARNCGISNGHSPWIAYIDDDDQWLSDHLTILHSMRVASPNATMLRTAGQSFKWGHKHPRTSKLVRKLGAVNSTDILTVGMSHTRKLFELTDGWQPGTAHDRDLWNNLLKAGGQISITNHVTFQFER